ncbi:MAG: ParB N-terminal domain-containing protein [Actinobacteria bacterium]|nr:ParB N-terminal domain-containing protein [Actinomycetota bacterium]
MRGKVKGTTGALTLEMVRIEELKMLPSNAKTHSQKHIDKIVKSIKEFGFKQLILITTDSFIIAGHGRYKVGKKLGFPVYKKHLEGRKL